MHEYTDQLNRTIFLPKKPERIVSLVPSITELLYSLNLDDEVVGLSKFCEMPEHWRKEKTIIGGTKNVRLKIIKDLKPDLIIANKEENLKEDVDQLSANFPVWVSDVKNYEQSIAMIRQLGNVVQKSTVAEELIVEIEQAKLKLASTIKKNSRQRAVYLIWKNPIMVAGGDTFISDMMKISGLQNVIGHRSRYPELSEKELSDLAPELILLSSEPFPFKEKDIDYFQSICPTAVIKLVDGRYFSWYGSRLLPAMEYFPNFQP